MPRINPDDYLDYEDEDSLDIQPDDPKTNHGRIAPKQPPKVDRDWEENRKRFQRQRGFRDND